MNNRRTTACYQATHYQPHQVQPGQMALLMSTVFANRDVESLTATNQLADYHTKGLNREVFQRIQKFAQSW